MRPHAPISLQLVALLLASLVVAQAISFASIVLTTPPRPAIYRLSDIAAALRGGPLKIRAERPLTRALADVLPPPLNQAASDRERMSRVLADELGVAPGQVRLFEHAPSTEWRLLHGLRHLRGRAGLAVGGAGAWRHGGPGAEGAPFAIMGDFAAALQQPDGHWTVVRSTPEPFPSAWQLRILLWLLGGFLIVAPAGYLFARRITAPLKRFAAAAEALGRDPHGPQMTLSGPAEIGAAAQAFNEMQQRLRRYIQDRTGMVGAISHDLRTPLARIRFKMEAAPSGLRDSVLADVGEMEQMIGGVLAFIRDEGAPRQRERFDLLSLVECVADDAAMLGAQVEIVEGRPVEVEGDAVGLRRLFANLVDNAVKYGGEARIRVRREGDLAVVAIADRGPGIPQDELARVFQPFYRTDASRNLDKAGVGLGLPIARSTARAHGGDVELVSRPVGAEAIVTLPITS